MSGEASQGQAIDADSPFEAASSANAYSKKRSASWLDKSALDPTSSSSIPRSGSTEVAKHAIPSPVSENMIPRDMFTTESEMVELRDVELSTQI